MKISQWGVGRGKLQSERLVAEHDDGAGNQIKSKIIARRALAKQAAHFLLRRSARRRGRVLWIINLMHCKTPLCLLRAFSTLPFRAHKLHLLQDTSICFEAFYLKLKVYNLMGETGAMKGMSKICLIIINYFIHLSGRGEGICATLLRNLSSTREKWNMRHTLSAKRDTKCKWGLIPGAFLGHKYFVESVKIPGRNGSNNNTYRGVWWESSTQR